MTEGWETVTFKDRLTGRVISVEIAPEGDSDAHIGDLACLCHPKIEVVNGVPMLIHNSFDGREKFENLKNQ